MDASTVCKEEGFEGLYYLSACGGTKLLSGCFNVKGMPVVFKSTCPSGYSCRWEVPLSVSNGSCTKNPK